MKVLFVCNMWPDEARPWHGAHVKAQTDSLSAIGIDLEVLTVRGSVSRSNYLSAAARLAALNRGSPYDLVHAYYGHSGVVGRLHVRAPLVVSYCGSDLLGTPTKGGSLTLRSRVEIQAFRQLARLADATITKSKEMESRLPAARRAHNHVIPNGVDMERFRPIPRDQARARLGWDERREVVLFVGNPRLTVKNFALAEQVHRLVASRNGGVELKVGSSVNPADMPLWMSAADALLLTSRAEGSPNVVKEAMAMELPIVATPVGDVPERLSGVEGCAVCPAEPAQMSEALARALGGGRAPAARRAVAELDARRVAERIARVYEDVLAGR